MRDGKIPACKEHRCIFDECWRPRANLSKFCVRHTCSMASCVGFRPKSQQICSEHDRCRKDGCTELCCLGIEGEQRQYCRAHICEYSLKGVMYCNLEKPMNRRWCEQHQCNSSGCADIALHGPFCEAHLCRAWQDSACQDMATRDGYCEDHADLRVCHFRFCNRVGEFVSAKSMSTVYYCSDRESTPLGVYTLCFQALERLLTGALFHISQTISGCVQAGAFTMRSSAGRTWRTSCRTARSTGVQRRGASG